MLRIFADRGGDPERPHKLDPLDCLVWQSERPGEPAWDSPFGRGRPGWHVECSAIARAHLGAPVDVQGGGSDLVFPHHEMSAAEAQAASGGEPFARLYMHAGMVAFEGEKMSKSRGNLVFVSRLRNAGTDPMAIRLALLGHHYRSDWEWTHQDIELAELRLATWRDAAARATSADAASLVHDVRERLAADLDAPAALEAVDTWARACRTAAGDGSGETEVRALLDARLGIAL
jgi:L-cysteine:1D-myo-inositol 2-amino-2-deoxy-alpha-D-glucopyranoside ligase